MRIKIIESDYNRYLWTIRYKTTIIGIIQAPDFHPNNMGKWKLLIIASGRIRTFDSFEEAKAAAIAHWF